MIKTWRTTKNREKKTRQVTMLFKPSAYEGIQKIAYVNRVSANFIVGQLMEDYVSQHQDLIAQYDRENSNEE